jgi:hypothetical protein
VSLPLALCLGAVVIVGIALVVGAIVLAREPIDDDDNPAGAEDEYGEL